jgi:hypothetical protein
LTAATSARATSDGNAACTERACIALAHDPKQCTGHCDGFLTEDDGECGRCTCINGKHQIRKKMPNLPFFFFFFFGLKSLVFNKLKK